MIGPICAALAGGARRLTPMAARTLWSKTKDYSDILRERRSSTGQDSQAPVTVDRSINPAFNPLQAEMQRDQMTESEFYEFQLWRDQTSER